MNGKISMKPISFLLLLVSLLSYEHPAYSATADRKNIVFGVHIESAGGKGSSDIYNIVNTLVKVLSTKYGVQLSIKKFSTNEEVKQAFMDDKIDAAAFFPSTVAYMVQNGKMIDPIISYRAGKNEKVAYCLYQKKGSGVKEVKEISGRTLIRQDLDLFVMIQLREYLLTKGIDQPLWKTFGAFIRVPSSNSAFMAVSADDADLYWTNEDSFLISKRVSQNIVKNITAGFCTDRIYTTESIKYFT